MKYQYTEKDKNTVRIERENAMPLFVPRGHPYWVSEGIQAAEDAQEIAEPTPHDAQ